MRVKSTHNNTYTLWLRNHTLHSRPLLPWSNESGECSAGAQYDPDAIPDVLTAQQAHHDIVPPRFIYDAAAGASKFFAEVSNRRG